jgi:hypothetical protein
MVTVTWEEGMRGEASAYVKVLRVDCTHFPATFGVTVGATFRSDTGAENVNEIVVFGATFWVPAAGFVALT